MALILNTPLWSAVQDALRCYIEEFQMLVVEGERVSNERTRLLARDARPQMEEYNRQPAILISGSLISNAFWCGYEID